MKKKSLFVMLFGLIALLLVLAANMSMVQPASAASLPSTSVGTVTLSKANVCSGDTSEIVSATVTGSYDSSSAPTTTTSCDPCSNGNNYCGTGNSFVKRKGTSTTTTVTVANMSVTASALDSNGNSTVYQSGSSPLAFSQTLTAAGSDGKITVTVSATASEDVTTDTSTTVTYYSSTNCSSTIVSGPTTTPSSNTVTKTSGVAMNNADYLLDLIGPTVTPGHPGFFNNPLTIMQTQNEIVHMQIKDGSAGTPWSVTVTATGPDSNEITVTHIDEFGPSPDGIKNVDAGPFTLPTACDTPPETYTVAATLKTEDLCGNPYEMTSILQGKTSQ